MPLSTSIVGGLEIRRSDVQRYDDQSGGVFETVIFIDTVGAGETTQTVNFPCRYIEKPAFSRGWDMPPGQRLAATTFPVADCGVYVWQFLRHPEIGIFYYDGATLAINVLNGAPDLHLMFHLTFRGKALRNPAGLS